MYVCLCAYVFVKYWQSLGQKESHTGHIGKGNLSCVFPVTRHPEGHEAPVLITRISQHPLTAPRAPKESHLPLLSEIQLYVNLSTLRWLLAKDSVV